VLAALTMTAMFALCWLVQMQTSQISQSVAGWLGWPEKQLAIPWLCLYLPQGYYQMVVVTQEVMAGADVVLALRLPVAYCQVGEVPQEAMAGAVPASHALVELLAFAELPMGADQHLPIGVLCHAERLS
jgi:hypothetical protein